MDLSEINDTLARQSEAGFAVAFLPMDEALWLVGEVFRLRGRVTTLGNRLAGPPIPCDMCDSGDGHLRHTCPRRA